MVPYLFTLLAMIFFGLLGICHKLADRHRCTPFMITVALFSSSTVIMAVWVSLFEQSGFDPPRSVIAVAIPFGVVTAIALWVFQYGIRFGKITTSWLIINMSAAVPTVASTVIYDEPLGLKKMLTLGLIIVAILLLWKDMQIDKNLERQKMVATPVMGEAEDLPTGGE